MGIGHGEQTGYFGKWLTDYVSSLPNGQNYRVYYDHGDPLANKNVVAIKGIYGEKVSQHTQLADVDAMVVGPGDDVILLIEIEERISSPKKIAGDVMALLMCNRFTVKIEGKHHYFSISPDTRLIISGIILGRGSKREQLERVVLPRVRQFTPPSDGINLRNLSFVFCEDIQATILELKGKTEQLFGGVRINP